MTTDGDYTSKSNYVSIINNNSNVSHINHDNENYMSSGEEENDNEEVQS
jgi:hypothetical protein